MVAVPDGSSQPLLILSADSWQVRESNRLQLLGANVY